VATEAVVLAAGSGSRFGGGKLLAPWRGEPLVMAAVRAALAAPVGGVTVVTGADAEAVGAAARAVDPRVRVVHAADHAEGMGASLRTGIGSLPDDAAAALVFLGDMPRVPQAVLAPLVAAVAAGAPAAAPVFGGRRGNPVCLAAGLFPQLLALTGDAGARRILDALGERLALVEAPDDGVLFDVDRPEDLSPAHPGESRDPSGT
jgi:molybdenum cofactor cytidylyltransferase